MEVRVLCALPTSSCQEKDYVRVHTCADPGDDTVTLATIQRVIDKFDAKAASGTRAAKRVKTLIMNQRMSPDEALVLATSYAERKHIEVVYAESELERTTRG